MTQHSQDNCVSRSAGRRAITLDGTFKSYASVSNLEKALEKHHVADEFHVKCMTTTGRWTAIFPQSNLNGGYVAKYAALGFLTLG